MSRLPTKKGTRRSAPSLGGEHVAAQATLADKPTRPSNDVPPQDARRPAATAFRSKVDRVLARFAPAHVVINDAHEVVQFHGNAGRYLELASGRARLNLLAMLREGLSQPLESSLRIAGERRAAVRRHNVKVRTNDGYETIDIEVTPLQARERKDYWFLVVFQSTEDLLLRKHLQEVATGPAKSTARTTGVEVATMRQELAQLRESLRLATQQQERTNGELQSANEEVQSANEELQNINEELETSREQLQTSNDELLTVNDALLARSIALAETNSQLSCMLNSMQVAVLIVDRELRIRRFTAAAQGVFKILPTDVGRPIQDLKLEVSCPELHAQTREVIETGATKSFDVQDRNGRYYSLLLRPYRTEANRIDGAAIMTMDRG